MQSKTKELDPILEVNNLFASIENLPILKGVTISVNPGEIHAIMGRNGCGKSTPVSYTHLTLPTNREV